MVEITSLDNLQKNYNIGSNVKTQQQTEEKDVSIFQNANDTSVDALQNQLNEIVATNGVVGEGWDDFKKFSKLGLSSDDCNKAIEDYKSGKISFEQAEAKINEYKNKQESSVNLFSNIATGAVAILAGTAVIATGGLAAIGVGAATGAIAKAGIKTVDRATNKVEGDALDGKQIAKDALSGAVTGGIGVATAGTAGNPFNNGFAVGGKTLIEGGRTACVAKCAVTGLETGAISGASNNLIECAFEEDKEFNLKDFATETATGAVTGATVGAIMGGVNGTLRSHNILKHGGKITTNTTTQDTAANIACSAGYKTTTNAVKNTAKFLSSTFAA